MCGISGFFSKGNSQYKNNIKKCLNVMKNRGPDSNDFFYKKENYLEIGLLHSRLNIIDMNERSNQPFYHDGYVLIFNGEIYNYLELKKKLSLKYSFKTNSDTEVLLCSYLEYGENCVDHFIGMWSFVIFDPRKKIFFISRDIFGEKPLYYVKTNKYFLFGSEIKYIQSLSNSYSQINKKKINSFLFNGYKSLHKDNETFFENIFALEPGTNMILNFNLAIKKKKYFQPKFNKNNFKINYVDAVSEIKRILKRSLKLRMRSDVPIAFCLSGGIDSGLLASIAKKKLEKKVNSFSIIDQDKRYNEEKEINLILKDTKIKNQKIFLKKDSKSFFRKLKNLTNYHDAPIATISYYIHSFLSEEMKKNNFKVSISGTGADELFTGYYDHYLLFFSDNFKLKNYSENLNFWKRDIRPLIRNSKLQNHLHYIENKDDRKLIFEEQYNLKDYRKIKKLTKFSEVKFCNELLRNRMFNELFYETVPMVLKHDDMNSMKNSIENRSPYLDKELFEFAFSLPPNFLINNGYQKKILRDASKNVLVDAVRNNKRKKGFNASINSFVKFNKTDMDNLFGKSSPLNDFVKLENVRRDINFDFIPNHHSKFLFSLMTTKFFLDKYY